MRTWRIAGMLVVAMALVVAPQAFSSDSSGNGPAQGRMDQGVRFTYFSDASMTTVVGIVELGCKDGIFWGEETPYYTEDTIYCAVE